MTDDTADRRQALEELRQDRLRTNELMDAMDAAAYATAGVGGGDWSPKDVIGHLESWEQHALDAIAAWGADERPPIGVALETLGTDEVNRREAARKAALPVEEVLTSAAATHRALLEAIEAVSDEWWHAPADADRTHGQRIGAILGGELGLFRHDPDHHKDLGAFAADHPAES